MAENPIYVVTTQGVVLTTLGAFRDREVAGLLAQVEEGETGEAMGVVELELFESVVPEGPMFQLNFSGEVMRPRGAAWWNGLVCPHDPFVEYIREECLGQVSDLPGVACVRCVG